MKIVTFTYRVRCPDEMTDEECYESAIEIFKQDSHFPDDDQVEIRRESDPHLHSMDAWVCFPEKDE